MVFNILRSVDSSTVTPDQVPLVPEKGIKISQIAHKIMIALALLSAACVIASGVLFFHVMIASALIGLIISAIAFSVLSIALTYPSVEGFMPSKMQGMGDLIAGVAKEVFAASFVFGGMIVQGIFGKEDEPFDQTGNPILLSSGYLGTSGQLFYLKYHLKNNNAGAVFTMDYEDPFASIDDFAETMKERVEEIQRHYPGKKVTIVGHSMGGIIGARYAANCENTDHIAKVITLGSPLQGTYWAYLGHGNCAREMRRKAYYLKQLEEDLASKNISFINVSSRCDLIVLPNKSTSFKTVPSEKIKFGDIGHGTYLCSDKVAAFLIRNIN